MTALAAATLGYRCHIFCPERESPAAQVSAAATVADYADREALARFAREVAVVTYEFENIPHAPVAELERLVPVRPSANVLQISQDRIREKSFLNGIGIATAPWRPVTDAPTLENAILELGVPSVLKTARLGYDGKGQVAVKPNNADATALWAAMTRAMPAPAEAVLEGFVNFEREISVIVARGPDGKHANYVAVENRHEHHILAQTIAPARIPFATARRAEGMARHIAEKLGLVGILAVEMFVGENGDLMVNELAPRPHNSGHWTIDACVTSQFEQVVRAICGLPLGSPRRHSDAVMDNLIGDAVNRWPELVKDPDAKLHLYGKAEARPGRKMGHVTRLLARKDEIANEK
jgi:5-(carboxyamino)imidazole ribonucleotide synthase